MKKRAEIRQRIKHHVINRGDSSDFKITETFCVYWWNHLNEAIFDGKLTQPVRFEIRRFRRDCGWWKPYGSTKPTDTRRSIIGINSNIKTRCIFLDIMVHEMVHQCQWEINREESNQPPHGKSFYVWSEKIKQAGLNLQRSYQLW